MDRLCWAWGGWDTENPGASWTLGSGGHSPGQMRSKKAHRRKITERGQWGSWVSGLDTEDQNFPNSRGLGLPNAFSFIFWNIYYYWSKMYFYMQKLNTMWGNEVTIKVYFISTQLLGHLLKGGFYLLLFILFLWRHTHVQILYSYVIIFSSPTGNLYNFVRVMEVYFSYCMDLTISLVYHVPEMRKYSSLYFSPTSSFSCCVWPSHLWCFNTYTPFLNP